MAIFDFFGKKEVQKAEPTVQAKMSTLQNNIAESPDILTAKSQASPFVSPKLLVLPTFLPFSKYDLPSAIEVKNKDYVQLGKDHQFTRKLSDLSMACSIHGSVIYKKQLMVTGKGFNVDGMTIADYTKNSSVADSIKLNEFMNNAAGECDLNEVLSRIALDYEIFGAFALEILWSNDMESIAAINYFPVMNLCIGKPDEYGKVCHYYFSRDWTDAKFKPICIPAYDSAHPCERQILYVKRHNPGVDLYGVPRYIAAVTDIEARAEMSIFQANNVREGFSPAVVVKYYQEPKTQEEADFIARGLAKSFQGPKGKKLMVMFGNGKELTPDVTPIAAQNVDKQFTQLVSDTSESIVSAHGVTNTLLMGISVPGKLGGESALSESYDIFYHDEIEPTQLIITKTFEKLAKQNDINVAFSIERSTPTLTKPE